MVAIAVAPFVLKDMIFQVGTDSYEQHVSSVAFTPETETVKWQGGTPAAAFTDTTNPSWTCTIECAQDWVTPNSLVQYLLTNAGTAKTVIFKPQGTTTGTGTEGASPFGGSSAAKGHTVADVLDAVLASGDPSKACAQGDFVTEAYL